ncbi:MAG: serine/threonine-protein kinase, partial [Arthrobacter sp.]
ADALAYVHGLGVIHRDVKPANILLVQIRPGEPLRPKLTDFGIARIADGTRLTATGAMVGTAAYLSPEQAMGLPLTPATDVYSLGLVLLECMKQAMEYPGGAVESAVARLYRAPEIPEDLPAEWTDLIRSMTAIEPLERPAAADIEIALRQALVSPDSTPGELAPKTTRVLPAMPLRPPSITSESPTPDFSAARPTSEGPGGKGVRNKADQSPLIVGGNESSRLWRARRAAGPSPLRPRRRLWLAAFLLILALAGGSAALTAAGSQQSTPDVVPYPMVTGPLGDHLQKLQQSVEP